jgi:hypothetical protein
VCCGDLLEVLLVGFVFTFRVSDLLHDVFLLVEHVVANTGQVSVLKVSVQVDLDDTVTNGGCELLLAAARTTVEHQEQRLLLLRADLLLGVGLVLAQELGVQLDVAGLVDTVDVPEASGDGEVGGNTDKGLVDIVDVLGLGVERVVVDAGVVDTVFLTTGDADLLRGRQRSYLLDAKIDAHHLQPLLHGSSTLEVLLGDRNVLVLLLL